MVTFVARSRRLSLTPLARNFRPYLIPTGRTKASVVTVRQKVPRGTSRLQPRALFRSLIFRAPHQANVWRPGERRYKLRFPEEALPAPTSIQTCHWQAALLRSLLPGPRRHTPNLLCPKGYGTCVSCLAALSAAAKRTTPSVWTLQFLARRTPRSTA